MPGSATPSTQTTNDAYVRAELTRLSSRVAGEVLTVAVNDFQRVKAGDLLIQIDPADYQAQVAQADAAVVAAQAALDNLSNQVELQYATIAQAEAPQVSAAAEEVQARQEQERQQSLSQTEAGTRQKFEQATAAYAKAQADVRASRAVIAAQKHQMEVLAGTKKQRAADVLGAQAALAAARLKLGYTKIVAPFDGVVGERQVQPGDYVNIGSNLINVVPLPNVYVIANYKETQLTRVKPGQPVDITVDSFPDEKLHGRVERISPASRIAIRAAAAGQRHRQFHQGGAAHPGPDSARQEPAAARAPAAGHVRRHQHPHRRMRGRMAENDGVDRGPVSRGGIAPQPLFAVGAVLLGSFLANFDSRLTSVGLADLRGAFSLGFDEGAWLSTAGIGSQIFIAPAVAWLATVFGLRRVLGIPSLVYALVSLTIPFVHDYPTLIVLSIVHGMLLGTFVPATLMIVFPQPADPLVAAGDRDLFHPRRLRARYLDLAGRLLCRSLGLAMAVLAGRRDRAADGPDGLSRHAERARQPALLRDADWGGMLLLGTAVSMIYAGLDQGNRLDWLESGTVMALLLGGGVLFILFLINEMLVPQPWAHFNVLFSRNIGLSLVIILLYTLTSLCNSSLVPNFLSVVGQLRPEQTGVLLFTWGALPMFVLVPISIYLLRHFDARAVVVLGLSAFADRQSAGARSSATTGRARILPASCC